MNATAEFFKIFVRCAESDAPAFYLLLAMEPTAAADGREFFRRLSFVPTEREAGIWPEHAARAVLKILLTTHPRAAIAPATFAEWIEAEAGVEAATK